MYVICVFFNCSYLWINIYMLLFNKCSVLICMVGYQASRCQNNALHGQNATVVSHL